jgi:hypothetical protein
LPRADYCAGALRANLARHLSARHGLEVDPRSMVLPEGPASAGSLGPREVLFLGRPPGQRLRDVYFAQVIFSAQGIPVHASPAFSLSRTSAADEAELRHDGARYLAYTSVAEGKVSVITILDLGGLSADALSGFSASQRLRQHLTNWQETGRWGGLDRVEVKLNVPQMVHLSWHGGLLRAVGASGSWDVVVDPRTARVLRGPAQARPLRVGKRSFIAWAVDTVRAFSFVGPDKIAWLEDLVYGVVDRARRVSGAKVTAGDIRDEMALPVVAAHSTGVIAGWPPPPLKPMLPGALKGEGQWTEVEGPFLRRQPGMPSYFAMTFVRPDAERLFARVYFVAWDPRRLDLRMVGGTAEPRSATGEQGRGMISRDPKLLPHLVAAFNGGFQSMHGDFGMMEDRRVYCPPRPWAATVARLADGSTGFGTWDGKAKAGWIPDWILSFRQNLTPMVEDSQFNPWRRGSWGGGAGFLTGSGPTAFIIRSGLCLHRSGHLMFALGNPVDGPTLGKAMHRVGCSYAMELDINQGHVGFEFYNVLTQGEPAPKSFTEEKYFARSGDYPGVQGLRYAMREVVRGTGNSPVPRYVGREARDFFYLVTRDLLPGPDLRPLRGKPDEGRWTAASVPKDATLFPPAMVRTFLHANQAKHDLRVHLVKMDMRWMEVTLCLPKPGAGCLSLPSSEAGPAASPALAVLPLGEFSTTRGLFAEGKTLAGGRGSGPILALRPRRPEGPALPELAAQPAPDAGSISVQSTAPSPGVPGKPGSALCALEDGSLLYATGLGAGEPELVAALKTAGCTHSILLGAAEPLLLSRGRTYETAFGDLFPPVASSPSLIVRRSRASFAPRIFTHVKPQPRSVWTVAQPERTRASSLHRAKKAAEALGLPPPKTLDDLCRAPYAEHKEIRQYQWRDPQTGRGCGVDSGAKTGPSDGTSHRRKRRVRR